MQQEPSEQITKSDVAPVDAQVTRTFLPGTAAPTLPAPGDAGGSRFAVLRPHAAGGLGTVSVAHDAELNREVAFKEIRPEYADHPESQARFLLEGEITGG